MSDPSEKGRLKQFGGDVHVHIEVNQQDVTGIDPEKVQPFIRQLAKLAGMRAESQALKLLKDMVDSENNYAPF